jgi:hypothetical protein
MESGALVASGCCHRGPARGAVDCDQPDNRHPDHSQPDNRHPDRSHPGRHVVSRLPADEFSPCLGSKFHARVDDSSRILRVVFWDRSRVTAGDLV